MENQDYYIDGMPPGLETRIRTEVNKYYKNVHSIIITIGKHTGIKKSGLFFRNEKQKVYYQVRLEDLIKISKKSVPFDRVPLSINDPTILPIMKIALKKRLELGL